MNIYLTAYINIFVTKNTCRNEGILSVVMSLKIVNFRLYSIVEIIVTDLKFKNVTIVFDSFTCQMWSTVFIFFPNRTEIPPFKPARNLIVNGYRMHVRHRNPALVGREPCTQSSSTGCDV